MAVTKGILTAIVILLVASSIGTAISGTSDAGTEEHGIVYGSEEWTVSDPEPKLVSEHYFTENRGQWAPEIRFVARTDFGRMAITDIGVIYDIREATSRDVGTDPDRSMERISGTSIKGHVIKTAFEGGSAAKVGGAGILPTRSNYFIGEDGKNWAVNVPSYQEVVMEDIYVGIDARFYFQDAGVKYDLILEPTADPHSIEISVEGVDGIEVAGPSVEFVLDGRTCLGDNDLMAYGSDSGDELVSSFRSTGENSYGFDISDRPRGETMVIDPIIRSAFLSGEAADQVHEAIIGPDGSHYIGGMTFSLDFPITPGAYQMEMNTTPGESGSDLFLTRMNKDLDRIIFSTFIGGLDHEVLTGMSLLSDGSVIMTGYTSSANFPNTTGAADNIFEGYYEGFVLKLSPDGDDLIFSTFLGGDNNDWVEDSCTDAQGRVYLTGWTFSSDFPQTGVKKNLSSAPYCLFVTVMENDGSSILRSLVMNSSISQRGYCIDHLLNGNVMVSGYTYNRSFPITQGCLDIGAQGIPAIDADLFLTEIDIFNHTIVRSGKIGGSVFERPDDIEVDENGDIWIAGETTSPDLPLTDDAFQSPSTVSTLDWFVIRVDRNITTLEYSTYISGDKDEWNLNIEIGDDGLVYLSGKTFSSNITMTADAFDDMFDGTTDIALMVFRRSNMSLVHSTYLGGHEGDYAESMIYTSKGTVAIGGYTIGDFPHGNEHYLNHSEFRPGFLIYYQLPIPPGPPENLSWELFQEDGDQWINLSWDPPLDPGNGRPLEYEVHGIDREGHEILILDHGEPTDEFLQFERFGGVPYEDSYFVTASSISGTSGPSEVITITEDEPPTFGEDRTPDNFTEDTSIIFDVVVRDNYRLDRVWVEYWYPNLTIMNLTLEHRGEYRYNATVHARLAWGPIHYRFHAIDVFGNANQTEERMVDAIDLEAPIVIDLTPSRVEFGQNITFRFRILEGSGIGTLNFTIHYLGKDHFFDLAREDDHNWTFEFEPLWNLSVVYYYLWVRDLYGWESIVERQVNITDTTPPVLVEDLSNRSIEYNHKFLVTAVFWDLSPIDRIVMWYCIPAYGYWINIIRTGTDKFSIAVKLPWDEMDPSLWESEMAITYYFIVSDIYGNTLRTENVTRNITDPVHIGPLTLHHPNFGYTGEEFLFAVEVDEGTEVNEVNITIWYHTIDKGTYSMDQFEDPPNVFFLSTVLIEDSLDPLHYEIILSIPGIGDVTYGPYNITIYDGTPPMVYPIHDLQIDLGDTVKVIVNAYDNIGISRYQWEGAPIDVSGNVLNWWADREGIFDIKVTAFDDAGNSRSISFTITVKGEGGGGDEPDVTEEPNDVDSGAICLGVLLVIGIIVVIVILVRKQKQKEEQLSKPVTEMPSTVSEKIPTIIDLNAGDLATQGSTPPLEDKIEEGPPGWETAKIPAEVYEENEEKLWEDEVMAKESVPVQIPEGPRLAPLPPPLIDPEER